MLTELDKHQSPPIWTSPSNQMGKHPYLLIRVCWFQLFNVTEAGIYFFALTSSTPPLQQIPFAEANFLIPSL